jgi:hypothetical protein
MFVLYSLLTIIEE